jgi:hypothetical protein
MNISMTRAATCAFALCCLVGLRAQTVVTLDGLESKGKAVRIPFERQYPPDRTYAVVVRADLPTIPVKGAHESGFPIQAGETGWKGPGSMFRAKPAGNLALGEVMKVEHIDYANDHVDLRLVSADPHEIVVDASRPDRNKREPVVTLLTVPHVAGIDQLIGRIDAYVRLFASLDAAREYARTIRDPQPTRRFTLGVVRRDGILVPIASYDNGHWFRRWPLPSAEREVPIGLGDIPADWWGVEGPTTKWTMWTPDNKPLALQVSAPLAFGAHCLMNVGLRTDFRTNLPHPPLDQHHYPKDGVATTGSIPVEAVNVITADTTTWGSFEKLIAQPVNQMELRHFSQLPWSALAQRSITPVKLEVLVLADGSAAGTVTAYFEASKRYAPQDRTVPDPCGVVTFAQGFAHRAPEGVGELDRTSRALVTDCSMWDVEFRKPLGVVRVDGGPIWIIEVSRWGGESYELVRVRETGVSVVLSIPGGSCGKIAS